MVGIRYEGCPPRCEASFLVATAANMHDVLRHIEVVGRSIVPIGKYEIALEDELWVVELVHDNRSISLRQSQCGFAAIIDQPMRHVQWNPKQISLPPPKTLRLSVGRHYFGRTRSGENVIDFLVHMMLRLESIPRGNLHHIQSRNILQPIELNEGAVPT